MLARLLAIALLLTLLFTQSPSLAAAQEGPVPPPIERLAFDGPSDLPHLPSAEVASAPDAPTLSPAIFPWSRLTFQSLRNEKDWEVYTGYDDWSNQVNLTNYGTSDVYPRFNRGATRIAYASNRDGNYKIYTINPDGSGRTRLTNLSANDIYPYWSPDGSRIVFQSYRDGQAELYVMSADGSGVQRLTNYGDYDGEPAWSPDGTQIAFTRRSGGQVRIWVMNADGSNARQLSDQASSENPVWSPNGRWIAYDADGDGNGWQELWRMDASGGNQQPVYTPFEPQTDAWARSWSPDSRYIAFTRISFIQYQGNWYWTAAYLDAWNAENPGTYSRLSNSGMDWHPDWQSTDIVPPNSQVLALPGQSPATFTVQWTGADLGNALLAEIRVQVRDGAGGAWTDWRSSSTDGGDVFTGVGGHTYYFRSQATDHARNVEPWPADYDTFTQVEALPPQTAVEALPPYSRNDLMIRWGGRDPGGSGIQSYDVQVRAGLGAWADWQTGTPETRAVYSAALGETYSFRGRARDHAGNVEPWPAAADAVTTLYAWAIRGQATDNRGAPVVDLAVTTAPVAFAVESAARDGAYAAHVAGAADQYTVTWSKPGYAALPATDYPADEDANVDVVLPPADNIVQNWGFEDGNTAWQFSGSLSGAITDVGAHSGGFAALLGTASSPLSEITILPDPPVEGRPPGADSVMDSAGVIHYVWNGPHGLLYSRKPPYQPWTAPVVVPGTTDVWVFGHSLAVDNTGTLHLAWNSGYWSENLYYSRNPSGAGWSAPELVIVDPGLGGLTLVVDGANVPSVAWWKAGVMWSRRTGDGQWTPPVNISAPYNCNDCAIQIAADPAGRLHALILWHSVGALYTTQTADGSWLLPILLADAGPDTTKPVMAIDAGGAVHVVWGADGLYYRKRPAGGTWSPIERIASTLRPNASIAVDHQGTVHLLWSAMTEPVSGAMFYTARSDHGWSAPVKVAAPPVSEWWAWRGYPLLAVDLHNVVHALWIDRHYHTGTQFWGVRYARRDARGHWSFPIDVYHATNDGFEDPRLLIDASGAVHAMWAAYIDDGRHPVYAGPSRTQDTGEATLFQDIHVPGAVAAPTLSFMHRFGSSFTSDSRLEVEVDDGSTATTVFSTNVHADAWRHAWADLTPWAGQTVTIRFRLIQVAGGARASAHIDEVSVGSAHPDTWVGLASQSAAPPGGTASFTIGYGNRGGVAAANARVTLQLPPELTFVSANPPPSAATPELRWDVGTLAAQSAGAIRVTVRVEDTTAYGTSVLSAAAIASDTAELEEGNNTAEGSIFIGHLARLPIIHR